MKYDEKALVVFSGGQDSTTCLFWAKENFKEVIALSFSYGQRHANEVDIAREIAEDAGVEWHCMDAGFISSLSHNSLTDMSISVDKEKPSDSLPNTFVPGRNMFFISIAAVFARERGIRHIVTGVSQTDFSGYPDCRDNFIKSLNVTINLAMEEQFVIHTPLMWKDKAQVWALSDELGVFDLVREKTITCYNGVVGDGCGECPSCRLRKKGLDEYLSIREKK
ncbi:MAG: 7-cyano-7-deazaguanine synthase QueC [Bacteroidales bacterium]|nr:7-cyano-7-deazaguanine synthase QueC [Bacteroidales bacterium]